MNKETNTGYIAGATSETERLSAKIERIWTCEHGNKCKWPPIHGFPHWGLIQQASTLYIKTHGKYCDGRLLEFDLIERVKT